MKKLFLFTLLSILSTSFAFTQDYEWVTGANLSVPANAKSYVFIPYGSPTNEPHCFSLQDNGANFKIWMHEFNTNTNIWSPKDSMNIATVVTDFWIKAGATQTVIGFGSTDNNFIKVDYAAGDLSGLVSMPTTDPVTGFVYNQNTSQYATVSPNASGTQISIFNGIGQSVGSTQMSLIPNIIDADIDHDSGTDEYYVVQKDNDNIYAHKLDNGLTEIPVFSTANSVVPNVFNSNAPYVTTPTARLDLIRTLNPHSSVSFIDNTNKLFVVPLDEATIGDSYDHFGSNVQEFSDDKAYNKHIVLGEEMIGANTFLKVRSFDYGTQQFSDIVPGQILHGQASALDHHSVAKIDQTFGRTYVNYQDALSLKYTKFSNHVPAVQSFVTPSLCNGVTGVMKVVDSVYLFDEEADAISIASITSSDNAILNTGGLSFTFNGAGGFYEFYADTIKNPGPVYVKYELTDGFSTRLDSILVNINAPYAVTENQTACSEYIWPVDGILYTASGLYEASFTNAAGCDSIHTLSLTILSPSFNTINEVVCDTYTVPSGAYTVTTSGTYQDTLVGAAANGCDSILTIALTVNYANTGSETVTNCGPFTWAADGMTYASSGTYNTTLTNTAGCDSIVTLNLTINAPSSGSETVVACDFFFWATNSMTYSTSGIYNATIPNAVGCDSVVTLDLTVNYANTGSETVSNCGPFTWAADGMTYASSGTYNATLTNVAGCDSVVTLDLTILTTNIYNFGVSECIEYTSPSGLYTWTTSGVYNDTLFGGATNGCDSIMVITLTIESPVTNNISIQACNSLTSPSGLYTWTTSGMYNDTIFGGAANGCDSILIVNAIINYSTPVAFNSPDYEFCTNGELLDFELETGVSGGYYEIGYTILTQNGVFEPGMYDVSQGLTNTVDFYYTNNFGCSSTASAGVSFFLPADITLNITDASCGGNNGEITATVTNNNTTYTSFWNTGEIDVPTISNLSPGSYYLEVEDDKGCVSTALGTVQATDITITEVITDATCFGDTDGSIDITIVGAGGPFTYLWSNGTSQEDAANLNAGIHTVTVWNANNCMVTKNFTVGGPLAPSIQSTTQSADCGLANGNIFLGTLNNMTGTPTYSWNNGVNTSSNLNVSTGTYTVLITDANGCTLNHTASVGVIGGVDVTGVVVNSDCNADNGSISIYESPVSVDTIVSVSWDNGMTGTTISGLAPGTYTSTVSSSTGCVTVTTWTVEIAAPLQNPICIVTVDSTTTTNLVVWEKVQTTGIDHYNIYRETPAAGIYELIDTVNYNNISVFNDVVASPAVNSWRYKISAVNDCGIEGPRSLHHKTIHLTFTTDGTQSDIFFDDYEGIVYSTVELYRYSNENGWEPIQTLPFNQYTFVDVNITGLTGLDYMAEVEPSNICTATTGKAQDYNSSRSNKAEGKFNPGFGTGDSNNSIVEVTNAEFGAMVYPNPTKGIFNIEIQNEGDEPLTYTIIDLNGSIIGTNQLVNGMNTIDIESISNGIYIVKIYSENTTEVVRVVKN